MNQFYGQESKERAEKPQPHERRQKSSARNQVPVTHAHAVYERKNDQRHDSEPQDARGNTERLAAKIGRRLPDAPMPETLRKENQGNCAQPDGKAQEKESPVQ